MRYPSTTNPQATETLSPSRSSPQALEDRDPRSRNCSWSAPPADARFSALLVRIAHRKYRPKTAAALRRGRVGRLASKPTQTIFTSDVDAPVAVAGELMLQE